MSLCNIIKLENRMYKLIPQPAAPAKTGTEEEEEVRGAAGRMDAACAEDRNPGAASAHRADKRQMHAGDVHAAAEENATYLPLKRIKIATFISPRMDGVTVSSRTRAPFTE